MPAFRSVVYPLCTGGLRTRPVADAPVLGASRHERFDGYHSPGGRCSRLDGEDQA